MKNKTLKNQSGQAAVEYILLLVVVVAIGVGVLTQFGKGFRTYADNYFGAYFECLLQAGELPSLGFEGDSRCDDAFQAFTLDEGRPPVPDFSSEGSSSGDRSRSNAGKGKLGQDGAAARGSRTEARQGGGGRPGARRGGRGAFKDNLGSNKSKSSAAGGKNLKSESDDGRGANTRNISTSEETIYVDGEGARGNLVPIMGSLDEEDKKNLAPKSVPMKKEKREDLSPERVPAMSKEKKSGELKAKDEPMDFGDFLRYIIIGAIIVAVLVFFGGQILQFQKSME